MNDFQDRKIDAFRRYCLLFIFVIGLFIPPFIVFYLEITLGDITPIESLMNIAQRQFAEGHNLFLHTIIGLIPFGALNIILRFLTSKLTRIRFCFFTICGLAGILALMIPAHVSVWQPLYTDVHTSSTVLIAFRYIPFYCLGTMGIGVGIASLLTIPFWLIDARKEKERTTLLQRKKKSRAR